MSGNLKILPKKSWHVWGRDNIEKVARDKRLAQEGDDLKRQKEVTKFRETQLASLRKMASGEFSSSSHRVFGATDHDATSLLPGNDDYAIEKARKDQTERKRDGTAPWALGEGSVETNATKPWYLTSSSTTRDDSLSSSMSEKRRRMTEDPMSRFATSSTSSSQTVCTGIVSGTSLQLNVKLTEDDLTRLRKRRLGREHRERQRAVALLAQADIYGPPIAHVDSGNYRYNQQYYPHLSRK